MISNNPLRQYFRRPSVYLKLPSGGKEYPAGVVNIPESGELPVYPMTAIDEITAKTPDALFNGTAVTELIRSCIPDIKDPWMVNSIDLDAILIAIKAAGGNSDLEIESKCPSCKEETKYGLNLVAALSTIKAGDYSKELQVNELYIKFKPLTYKEMNEASLGQFEAQKIFLRMEQTTDVKEKAKLSELALKGITELTMDILTKAIEYIKTPTAQVDTKEYILDFLRNCDSNVYTTIRDFNAKLRAETEMKPLEIKCMNCSHEYKQPFTLNTSDFFG